MLWPPTLSFPSRPRSAPAKKGLAPVWGMGCASSWGGCVGPSTPILHVIIPRGPVSDSCLIGRGGGKEGREGWNEERMRGRGREGEGGREEDKKEEVIHDAKTTS